MNIKEIFRKAVQDRSYVIAFITSAVMLLALFILCIVEIRPSELQVPIRNTVFGITYTYREQWYNELAFAGFALLVWALHGLLALKLYELKDRRFGIAMQWLSVIVLAASFLMLMAIFKVISIVE